MNLPNVLASCVDKIWKLAAAEFGNLFFFGFYKVRRQVQDTPTSRTRQGHATPGANLEMNEHRMCEQTDDNLITSCKVVLPLL